MDLQLLGIFVEGKIMMFFFPGGDVDTSGLQDIGRTVYKFDHKVPATLK